MSEVIGRYAVDFVKWDHNRDLHEAVRRDGRDWSTGPPCGPRPARRTRSSTSCASGIRTWRSSRAPAEAAGSTSACWPGPTGSGRPTATTPSSGSRSSGGPVCSCHRSGWAPTSARRARTRRTARSTCRSGMLVALQGHAGLEWDITTCTPEELDALRRVVGALPRAAAAAAQRRRRAVRPPGPGVGGRRRRRSRPVRGRDHGRVSDRWAGDEPWACSRCRVWTGGGPTACGFVGRPGCRRRFSRPRRRGGVPRSRTGSSSRGRFSEPWGSRSQCSPRLKGSCSTSPRPSRRPVSRRTSPRLAATPATTSGPCHG